MIFLSAQLNELLFAEMILCGSHHSCYEEIIPGERSKAVKLVFNEISILLSIFISDLR